MKKRFWSGLLAAALAVGLWAALAVPATAAGVFHIDSNNVLTGYNGPGGDVVIPDGVTAIGARAFYQNEAVTSVTIPDSVTEIGYNAFRGCTGLASVRLPDSVTSIGESAFTGCTGLTSIVIPDSVTTLGGMAFWQCTALTDVTVGGGVRSFGAGSTFFQCTALTNVTLGEGLTAVCSGMFNGCTALTSIAIPDSVTKIEGEAFLNCGQLRDVDLGGGVQSIYNYAFGLCASLKELTFPAGLTDVGAYAFSAGGALYDDLATRLETITYAEGTKTLLAAAGMKPSLTWLNVPASVTAVRDGDLDRQKEVTVYGVAGSFMESYCALRGIPFVGGEPAAAAADLAYAATQSVWVDGVQAELQAYALKNEAGDRTNYVKVRDVAALLDGTQAQFNVSWAGAVDLETGKAYTDRNGQENRTPYSGDRPYTPAQAQTRVNGAAVELDAFVLTDDAGNGSTYYKLRDLGWALGFNVGWSAEKGVFLESGRAYDPAD